MKLNYRRTILVGFAFFLICAFWQAYDTIVPLILTNRFGMDQGPSGIIMSLDNIFAVFMLPLFGALSDRAQTKWGRRTPFILVGTVFACVFFIALGFATSLVVFILLLLGTLLSMALFRSPAVALMPDVTLKPLRSKGNAVINLMGTAGGIIVLAMSSLFHTSEPGKTDFSWYLVSVCGVMLIALVVFLCTVKEVRWSAEADAESLRLGLNKPDQPQGKKEKLTGPQLRSLLFILISVAFWFIGYNAVTSKYSVYASDVLHVPYATTLLVAQIAAVCAYVPVGLVASRFGRKKSVLSGILLLTVAFGSAAFVTADTPSWLMYPLFCLAGVGWATINVNSFPMVVELAGHSDVGKYTGYYYTASMAAQIVTPILSGYLVDLLGWGIFFPYAAIFAGLSFVTMLLVRHGDSKPAPKKSGLEHFDVED